MMIIMKMIRWETDGLLKDSFLKDLGTNLIGQTAYHFDSVGSTNDLAKDLARGGTPEGTLVLAEEQTAGRGRQGRQWYAPRNTSLLLSLVFYPRLEPHQAQRLTMVCSLAAAEAITQVTNLHTNLKWPNDLLIHGRKVAGLLAETSITGDLLDFVVVGIGINVNFDRNVLKDIAPWGSTLASEAGHTVPRRALLRTLLQRVEAWLPMIYQPTILHESWSACLSTLGQEVTVLDGHAVLHGMALAVDPDGALLVRDQQGRMHRFLAGDVSLHATGD